MRLFGSVRMFCLGMVAASLAACAQPYESKPNFFKDGYTEYKQGASRGAPATGHSFIIVNKGDTLYRLAKRHNTSVRDLASLNRMSRPYRLRVGQRLAVPSAQPAVVQLGGGRVHVVRRNETLYRISVNNNTTVEALAALNGIRAPYQLAVGQKVKLPGGSMTTAQATGAIAPPPGAARASRKALPRKSAPRPAHVQTAALTPKPSKGKRPLGAPPRTTNSRFIWPVEGRVISRFGGKATGLRNDGINIRTEEGAPVRAAKDGIVTYAGNELRGYGNLLLLRHSDGYITAYAHNRELLVGKGARVKKGQIIAAAGQTGSVTEPQLHFEIRRGSKAIDPQKYLGK